MTLNKLIKKCRAHFLAHETFETDHFPMTVELAAQEVVEHQVTTMAQANRLNLELSRSGLPVPVQLETAPNESWLEFFQQIIYTSIAQQLKKEAGLKDEEKRRLRVYN